MHAFQSILLITTNPLSDIKKHFGIDGAHPDIDTLVVIPEPTIGIESIRNLKAFTSRRPLKGTSKQVIISDAHLLTPEAQNALLKFLEEPPTYLTIILTAPHTHTFLATVLSRCVIIQSRPAVSREAKAKWDEPESNLLAQLLALAPAARLKLIPSDTKTRIAAVLYCDQLIYEAEKKLHTVPSLTTTHNLEILADCLTHITANSNPTLSLTDAILRLQAETSLATMAQLPEKKRISD